MSSLLGKLEERISGERKEEERRPEGQGRVYGDEPAAGVGYGGAPTTGYEGYSAGGPGGYEQADIGSYGYVHGPGGYEQGAAGYGQYEGLEPGMGSYGYMHAGPESGARGQQQEEGSTLDKIKHKVKEGIEKVKGGERERDQGDDQGQRHRML